MEIECQVCHQAQAEWNVRVYRGQNRDDVIRWWYVCDVCLQETFGPWLNGLPVLEEDQMWSSATKKVYRKAPTKSATAASSTT